MYKENNYVVLKVRGQMSLAEEELELERANNLITHEFRELTIIPQVITNTFGQTVCRWCVVGIR